MTLTYHRYTTFVRVGSLRERLNGKSQIDLCKELKKNFEERRMKMLVSLRYCVSLVVVLLICLSVFATDALALEQSVIEQSKNNYDLPKSSLNNTKVSPDVLKKSSPEFVIKLPNILCEKYDCGTCKEPPTQISGSDYSTCYECCHRP